MNMTDKEQLAKKNRVFTSIFKLRNPSMTKRKRKQIVQWHFLQEEKRFILFFKARFFHYVKQNQRNQMGHNNQVITMNVLPVVTERTEIGILTPKQILQRLPVAFVQEIGILTPKQILQRLPVAFVQVKVGKTSENVLNEIL